MSAYVVFSVSKASLDQLPPVLLHNIFRSILKTAVRSSPMRQQYKNGLMAEFVYAAVIAKDPQTIDDTWGKIEMTARNMSAGE